MSANYAVAKDCQLLRRDVEGVLTLAAQLFLASASASPTTAAEPLASSSCPPPLSVGPLVGAVLTEANTRALLLNTLVRVLVPAPRQSALLQANRHVQAANEVVKKQHDQQQQQNNAAGKSSNTTAKPGPQQHQEYRVGRVVGVVSKPGAKSTTGAGAAAIAVEAPQRWLLAVYLGECVEPFHVTALSDEPFTEAEHRIFVQSALTTNREDGSRRAGVLPSQQPALLSAEGAALVTLNVKELRRVLDLVETVTSNSTTTAAAAGEKFDAFRDAVLLRASGVKRPRGDEHGRGEEGQKTAHTTPAAAEGDTSSVVTYVGNGAASQAARLSRLTDEVATRGSQLQQLRQLLQQRDQEVKTALQQQQQREAQHRTEADIWRAKAEEQGKAQERAAREAAAVLAQRDGLLEEANAKLRRLAGMATKYKQVVDTVAALLRRGGEEVGGKAMSPEEIIAALQHKTIA